MLRVHFPPSVTRSFFILALILQSGCACLKRSPGGDTRDIQRTIEAIFDSAQAKDFARLDSHHLYDSRFTKFGADGGRRLDAASARKEEHDGLAAINNLQMKADELKIDLFGDPAVASFVLKTTFKMANADYQRVARGTLIFHRIGSSWKIVHEHFSPFATK